LKVCLGVERVDIRSLNEVIYKSGGEETIMLIIKEGLRRK
jgi:hypothetical protein